MSYLSKLGPRTMGLVSAFSLSALVVSMGSGCTPRAQTVTLDVPVHHPVSVARADVEPGSSKVTAIDVPFGGGAYRYKDKDLAVLQQMLDETNPMPGRCR